MIKPIPSDFVQIKIIQDPWDIPEPFSICFTPSKLVPNELNGTDFSLAGQGGGSIFHDS